LVSPHGSKAWPSAAERLSTSKSTGCCHYCFFAGSDWNTNQRGTFVGMAKERPTLTQIKAGCAAVLNFKCIHSLPNGGYIMAEGTKLPVKTKEKKSAAALRPWRPLENLRHEIDRLFEEFDGGIWRSPFGRSLSDMQRGLGWVTLPAVDLAETDKAYEIAAELPGMDEKNIEVKFADGVLTIKGEKEEAKEEKEEGLLSERT
jgi:Hsp20/alpha crystallin family